MLKIKSIKKEGKFLTIIIKKPYFKSYKKFIIENNLTFKDEDYAVLETGITIDGDIELKFVLRNFDDIKSYLKKVGDK